MSLVAGTLTISSIDVNGNPVYTGTGLAIFLFDEGITIGGTSGARTGAGRALQLIQQLDTADAALAAAPLQPDPVKVQNFIQGTPGGVGTPYLQRVPPDTADFLTAMTSVQTYAGVPPYGVGGHGTAPSWPLPLCSPPSPQDRLTAFRGLAQQCLNDSVVVLYIKNNAVVNSTGILDHGGGTCSGSSTLS